MALYRKKPVVIEAVQFVEGILFPAGWAPQLRNVRMERQDDGTETLFIETLRAKPGDWIIKGVKGELYPCDPEIFEQTYESAGGEVESPEEMPDELV